MLLAAAECRGRVRQAQVAGLAGAPDGATSWIAGSLAAQLPLDGIHMCHVGLGWALHLNPRWHIHGAVGSCSSVVRALARRRPRIGYGWHRDRPLEGLREGCRICGVRRDLVLGRSRWHRSSWACRAGRWMVAALATVIASCERSHGAMDVSDVCERHAACTASGVGRSGAACYVVGGERGCSGLWCGPPSRRPPLIRYRSRRSP